MQKKSIKFIDDEGFRTRIDFVRRLLGKDLKTFYEDTGIELTGDEPMDYNVIDRDGGSFLELKLLEVYGINPMFFLCGRARLFIRQGPLTPKWIYILYHIAFPSGSVGLEGLRALVGFREFLEIEKTTDFLDQLRITLTQFQSLFQAHMALA